MAHESGFVGFGGFKGGFDVAVGHAAGAEIARDAVFALFAGFGAVASELFGVAGVIDQTFAFQAIHHIADEFIVFAAAGEGLLHFVDGVGAAHEDFDGCVIEAGLGVDLARAGKHKEQHTIKGGER